jgi:hypothetical protein
MAITQALCNSFKVELAQGLHDFDVGANVFKIALFRDNASIVGTFGAGTTNYSDMGADEVSGTGYTAGGANLTNVTPVLIGSTVVIDFANITFSTVTVTSRGALIYNSTNGNRAVIVLDFGLDVVASASNLNITFPVADASNAVIRYT